MIGKLTGIIDNLDSDHIILDVGGVGYLVFASTNTINLMPQKGGKASLIIETMVKEDSITLFGFSTKLEKEWFLELIKVKAVGSRVALSILSALTPDKLSNIIAAQDKKALNQINGIGPKLAERIITELKNKKIIAEESLAIKGSMPAIQGDTKLDDAISALANLGYGRAESYNIIQKCIANNDAELGELIRMALKELAR